MPTEVEEILAEYLGSERGWVAGPLIAAQSMHLSWRGLSASHLSKLLGRWCRAAGMRRALVERQAAQVSRYSTVPDLDRMRAALGGRDYRRA